MPLDVKQGMKPAAMKRKLENKDGKYSHDRNVFYKKLARNPFVVLQSVENLPSMNQRTPSPKPRSLKKMKSQSREKKLEKLEYRKVSKLML